MPSTKQHTIGRILSTIGKGNGFAKPNRFVVEFIPPRGVQMDGAYLGEINQTTNNAMMYAVQQAASNSMRVMVESIEMPGVNLDTMKQRIYGPEREIVNGHSFGGDLDITFRADSFLTQRTFFETWQGAAYDKNTNNVHFYDEYVGSIKIWQLAGQRKGHDRKTYGVQVLECYPKTISAVNFDQGTTNEIQKITVSMSYRNWRNIGPEEYSQPTNVFKEEIPVVEKTDTTKKVIFEASSTESFSGKIYPAGNNDLQNWLNNEYESDDSGPTF